MRGCIGAGLLRENGTQVHAFKLIGSHLNKTKSITYFTMLEYYEV